MSDANTKMSINLYEVLGVSPQAEDIVIRAAYRALAQRYHPDKSSPDAKESSALRMRSIQAAYDVLSDPVSRLAYDASLSAQDQLRYFPSTTSFSIANLEAQSWEILLRLHPELGRNLHNLESTQQHLAKTYRSLLLELISEKLVSKLVNSICEEIKEIKPEARLTDSRSDSIKTNLH